MRATTKREIGEPLPIAGETRLQPIAPSPITAPGLFAENMELFGITKHAADDREFHAAELREKGRGTGHGRRKRKQILCVENDSEALALMTRILGSYEVKSAGTIFEARDLYHSQKFSLILLENSLPDGDGLAFCEEIREHDYLTPIIVVSSDPDLSDIDARIAGAQRLIKKCDPGFMAELRALADNLSV